MEGVREGGGGGVCEREGKEKRDAKSGKEETKEWKKI